MSDRKLFVGLLALSLLLLSLGIAAAADEPPPLPLHAVEGAGGVFATLTAYLVNPPAKPGEPGKPSLGVTYVNLGNGRNLRVFTLTEAVTDRVELGYSHQTLDLGDLPAAIRGATGIGIAEDSVTLQQFNARVLLVRESKKSPAVTFGVHYKTNSDTGAINLELGGALSQIGVTSDSGWDYTLYASKLLTNGPRPVLLSGGLRSTQAAHTGLLGFTDERSLVAEGSAVVFATNRLLLAAEYRQKPNDYTPIPGLIGPEDNWWTLAAAYIVNSHTTVAAGYAHFGQVLNHTANGSWGLALKHER
jgi:hypothetical protein